MKTPFLNALQAFEVACRLHSFSAAAEELNVTPAAVGQLVKSLEDWLDKPLFIRKTGGKARLQPTEVALLALPDVQMGLEKLAFGLQKMQEYQNNQKLTVAVSPIFAAKWLLNRLSDFYEKQPDIELFLNTNLKVVDFFGENIDIGIRYGKGDWQGLTAEWWQSETLFPVCSPAFLEGYPINQPSDLYHLPLIHDLTFNQAGFSWADWFAQFQSTPFDVKGLRINDSAAVLQAALDGQGVALARSLLAYDDLQAGRLVKPFANLEMPSPFSYFLVYRPERCESAKICAFREWLKTWCDVRHN